MYLKSFVFAETDRDVYPHTVIAQKDLGKVEFAPVTIFYGGNGSGKSTILNVIARSIGVRRMSEGARWKPTCTSRKIVRTFAPGGLMTDFYC